MGLLRHSETVDSTQRAHATAAKSDRDSLCLSSEQRAACFSRHVLYKQSVLNRKVLAGMSSLVGGFSKAHVAVPMLGSL